MCQGKKSKRKICSIFQVNETELINYVRDAFHMEEEKHQQLLEIATMKEVIKNRLKLLPSTTNFSGAIFKNKPRGARCPQPYWEGYFWPK